MEFLKPKIWCNKSCFFLNDVMFWQCFWKQIDVMSMFLTMFSKQKNIVQTMFITYPYHYDQCLSWPFSWSLAHITTRRVAWWSAACCLRLVLAAAPRAYCRDSASQEQFSRRCATVHNALSPLGTWKLRICQNDDFGSHFIKPELFQMKIFGCYLLCSFTFNSYLGTSWKQSPAKV